MEIGLALPQFDYSVTNGGRLEWSTVVEWATRAEQLGFGSVWLADHLFLSIEKYGGPPGEHFGFDPIVSLAALARATSRVRLGTLVLCAQLRPPRVLAKQLESLEGLAPGRVIAGVGAGWFEAEYRAAGIPFGSPRERLAQLAEVCDAIAERTGERVPRWIGGRGDRLLDVVARHADGWNTVWAWTPQAYRERVEVLRRACERARRDPSTIALSVGLTTLVGEDTNDLARRFERMKATTPKRVLTTTSLEDMKADRLVGTVEEVRAIAQSWRDEGVSSLVCNLGALPFSVSDVADLDLVAAALL